MFTHHRVASLLAATALGLPALALPFTPAFAADARVEAVDEAPEALPQPPAAQWQPLAGQGITLSLSYTGEAAANATGGLRKASALTNQIYMGADADLNTIAGWKGAAIHFAVTDRRGPSLSNTALGNNTSVQEVWGTQNTHLAIATFEQKLWNGAVDIEMGRSQANIHFLNSPIYCNFQSNSTCGNPTMVFKDSNFTYFPASSWMGQVKVKLAADWFAHAGVYEVNPDRKAQDDHGWSLSTRDATGVVVPWEAGYAHDGGDGRRAAHYILGGWFDRADYADPLLDRNGGIAVLTGQNAATRHGRSGIYLRFDQQITRPVAGSQQGLSVFGIGMVNMTGRVEETSFWELGLLQTGTFKGREADTLGFMVNDQRFSDLAVERMTAARVAAGGTQAVYRHEYMMELAYGAQLTRAIRLSPNIQYVLHPDNTGAPFRATNTPNALVFGLKFTVDALTLAQWGLR